jgi:putative Mg2+ transporter-C (MgtC) family protein
LNLNTVMNELTRSVPDLVHLVRIVGRLTVALVIGAAIGGQRRVAHKAAGVRTHMLVALGTALLLVSASDAGLANNDLSRIVQGIITGIGFLGGGAILKLTHEHEIRGLTTAAGIWLTAAASAAAGLGQIAAALIGLIFALIVLAVMGRYEPPLEAQKRPVDTPDKPPADTPEK